MKVAFITRSTLYEIPGGDTVQATQTARQLAAIGVEADIILSGQTIAYNNYDLLHFFNITRPADILHHSKKTRKPFVVSTILCNYAEYDKRHRNGVGALFTFLSANRIEYCKTMGRVLLKGDHLASIGYAWKGQRKSINEILRKAKMLLPNSESEYNRLQQSYPCKANYMIVPNGADPEIFKFNPAVKKNKRLILCVARIEGIKNQFNLIKALNNSKFQLIIIGAPAPNQRGYYDRCRKIAGLNITFIDHIPQEELVGYYQRAQVHVLPSWFETTGLSSLEAAVMGCNIVITDKGDTREYFGDHAFYCNPSEPQSILNAIEKASSVPVSENLRQKVLEKYNWKQAALKTLEAYQLAAIA
ncbi:MAG: glycosyltransferase family 4 protein [Bacteroidota bacterium]|nr:glycosyltransferase family 4 protein [Bacteroidota bacterium]